MHIAAMFIPGLNTVLGIAPMTFGEWLGIAAAAFSLIVFMEIYKLLRPRSRLALSPR